MTPDTFRAALKRLNLTQRDFAEMIGVVPNQVSRWAKGHAPVPRYAALIFDLTETIDTLNAQIESLRGVLFQFQARVTQDLLERQQAVQAAPASDHRD